MGCGNAKSTKQNEVVFSQVNKKESAANPANAISEEEKKQAKAVPMPQASEPAKDVVIRKSTFVAKT
jgi:hypothetical protein